MTFAVEAAAYDRHVGRYTAELARALVRAAGIRPGWRALDVGSGPGAVAGVLAELLGPQSVSAIDPSASFVEALRERLPGVDGRTGSAQALPYADGAFDAALAQLVVNFLPDAAAGVAEMRRVVREEGVVAAAVWDYPEEMTLLRVFWDAAAALDADGVERFDERTAMGFDEEGELAELWRSVGLREVEEGALVAEASYADFDDLWEPFTTGVGPAGGYVASLGPEEREALRAEYRRLLGSPEGPFRLRARAWYAVGRK